MLTREQLRTARTKFVHRWHAAQTIGERLGNDAVSERFEHINHAKSLAEYIWRYGLFEESADGTGRVTRGGVDAHSLRDIVGPVAAKGRTHFRNAVRYALISAGHKDASVAWPGGGRTDVSEEPQHQELQTHAEDLPDITVHPLVELLDNLRLLEYANQHPDIKVFASRIIALHRGLLRYYVQMRLFTPAEAEYWRTNPVPLFAPIGGYGEPDFERGPVEDADELPEDLIAALRSAFARNIYNALVARARAELFETIVRHPRGRSIASETTRWSRRHRYTASAIVQGRRTWFAIHDEALAAMLQSLYEDPMPPVIRWLAAFKTAVSAMITTMPMFIIKNFFRDTLSGFVAGRYWQIPFFSTLTGSVHAVHDLATGRSEAMREYLLQGGFFSALVESETHFADERVTSATLTRLTRWASRIVYLLTRPAWITESGTRVSQFRKALAHGATKYAAARAARMISVDFANIGASRPWRMYIHTVPFMNAAIQGFDQLYQIVRSRARTRRGEPMWGHERARHVRKVLAAGLCLGLMTGAVRYYNTSDDARLAAYQAETEYEKASWLTLYDVDGDRDIRIPTPFQIGAAFMKAPEVTLDLASGTDTLAGPRFIWSLIHGNLAIGWIPAIAQPVVEVRTNRNFFGSEIIPAYMQDWLPEQQYFPRSTPAPYRMVGQRLGVSPLHVQTFVRGWTGHLGNAVVTGLDELMWDAEQNGPKPFPRFTGLITGLAGLEPPKLRTFSRYSNEFYEISDWFRAYSRTVPRARSFTRSIDRVRRSASEARRAGDRVRTSRRLSRQEKEQRLIEIYRRIDARFQRVLPRMRLRYERWR